MNIRYMIRNTFFIFSLFMLLATSAEAKQDKPSPNLLKNVNQEAMTAWVDSVFNGMSLDERIGQTITIIAKGEDTPANRRELSSYIKNQHIGGILFSKSTPKAQATLTNISIAETKVPLLISLDGEWGLSMRLTGTTMFPKNMTLGAIQEDSLLYLYGKEVARQCQRMGIHVNFAPSLDINSNPANPVIGYRSFGENPKQVAKLGILYSQGLEDHNVLSVAKHFPGHGDTSTDSHKTLPVLNHNKSRLDKVELKPFRKYIEAGLSGMMSAHLNIPALEPSGEPTSLSNKVITELLKDELGFDGLVFTDGLAMKGVSSETNMSVRALQAGNHILLGPASPVKEFNAIKAAVAKGTIPEEKIDEICKKILSYKYALNVKNEKIELDNLEKDLNTPYAEWLKRKLTEKSITLLKNDEHIIPIKHLETKKIAVVAVGGSSNTFVTTAKQYGDVTAFSISNFDGLVGIKNRLASFNTIIFSIHGNKLVENQTLQNICADADTKSVLVFLSSPYRMANFKNSIKKADGVIIGYENTPVAQEYAVQAIFGGIDVNGRLPVSVKDVFDEGDGHDSEKIRLSYSTPEEVGMSSTVLDSIDEIVQEGIREKAFPGCQILVAKDGVVIYNRSFGHFEYNKQREVTNEDIYDLASMTKATATLPAVMKLYNEKDLKLNQPISKYVSALRNSDKSAITIKEALFHESGLTSFIPYYMPAIDETSYSGKLYSGKQTATYSVLFDNGTWTRPDYKYKTNIISPTPKKGYELKIADNLYITPAYKDTIISNIVASKLNSRKSYVYSCLNFMLLKEVVENISKKDLNQFVQTNFFERLGSTTTTYNPLDKFEKKQIVPTENDRFLRNQLLQGYTHDEGAAFMGGISGNAGLFSNANDIAKLYQMLLNNGVYGGERFLDKETCRTFSITKSPNSRRGLGFDKPDPRNNKGNPCSPQTPLSTYGHTGFTGTCFWIDPDNNLIYIFLSNRVNPSRTYRKLMSLDIRTRIQDTIYNALKK